MKKFNQPYNYKTALLFSLCVSLILNFIFILAFLFKDSPPQVQEGMRLQVKASHSIIILHIVFNFLLSFMLYLINFQVLKKGYKNIKNIILSIFFSILACIVLSYLFSNIHTNFFIQLDNPDRYRHGNLIRDLFITIIVIFSSQMLHLWNQKQQAVLENQKLIAKNIRAHYEVLKNQIDPHFLFNSLNTLNSLIKTDTDKAQEYVQVLSSVFRYSLQNKEITNLQEELKFAQSYCSLMKIRYGDNLNFEFNIDSHYLEYLIMPFCLQILIENAIKHNVISGRQPLTVYVSSSEKNSIIVSNPIQPKKTAETGSKIGLANLAEQYRLMLQKEINITQHNNTFSVEVPLVKKEDCKNLTH